MCNKAFNPIGKETWYVIEYDPEKELAFGFVDLGGYPELVPLKWEIITGNQSHYGW